MPTERSWHATLTCLGWAEEVEASITVDMRGPNGGKVGFGRVTPEEARRAAQELNDAADMVDPPKQLPEHNLYFRGYEIEPLVDPEENGGWQTVMWHRASCFRIYPPDRNQPALDCAPENLNAAHEAVIKDIEATLSPYALNLLKRSPAVVGRELDRLQRKIGEANRALQSVSNGGMLEAKRILNS